MSIHRQTAAARERRFGPGPKMLERLGVPAMLALGVAGASLTLTRSGAAQVPGQSGESAEHAAKPSADALRRGSPAAALSGEILPPEVIEPAPVVYPAEGRGSARVSLEAVIAEDGTVTQIEVRSGQEPFATAARHAVESWRFRPAQRSGLPVRARIAITLVFEPPPVEAPARATDEPLASDPEVIPALPMEEPVEVVVSAEQRRELGSIYVPRHEARLVPGAFADPFRVIEVMPGVAPILSGIPYFFVRGAPPGNVGYFIDGVRVPLLFHVGAGPAVIAPALVERVDLFASSYPARYGRYSGGIMAGETTEPSELARGEAQARVFDAGAFLELPFAEGRGSALLSGRYSYTQALLALVAPDFELGYWDYQARLAYRISDEQTLSVFAFGARDRLAKAAQQAPLFDTRFHRLDLRWDQDTGLARTRAALTLGLDHVAVAEEDSPLENSLQEYRSLALRVQTDRLLSPDWRLRAGIEGGVEPIDEENVASFDNVADYGGRTDLRGAAYADVVYRPRRGVEIVPGLRFELSRSRSERHTFAEPRLATRLRLRDGLVWESALGIANQLPTQAVRAPARSPNAIELLPQQAWQASESLEMALPLDALGKLTVFHTWTDADPIFSRNYGVEVFLRRDFTHRLGGFLSYTLSWARGSVDSQTFATAYDRRHLLSLVLGYRLGRGFRLGGRAYFTSGRPYAYACSTPTCGPDDPAALRSFLVEGRLPSFARVDVRFEKRWEFDAGRWLAATFEWFNAGVARERDGLEWNPIDGGLRFTSPEALTLPSIGVEAGF